ncbi:hypothetical protein B0H10DRAFT_2193056 [Mycena sp. CBHHK59/15]|nr:hypothetical protein B0H10DRAFT_2193056 [Mycena sp. CBHHK59/15]
MDEQPPSPYLTPSKRPNDSQSAGPETKRLHLDATETKEGLALQATVTQQMMLFTKDQRITLKTSLSRSDLVDLIRAVVQSSEKLSSRSPLTSSLSDAEKALDTEGMDDMLTRAWTAKDFVDIVPFVLSAVPTSHNHKKMFSGLPDRHATRDCHDALLNTLKAMKMTGKPRNYHGTVTILQSSCTGKSRLLDEVAKKLFTLPLNLRMDKDAKEGYSAATALQVVTASLQMPAQPEKLAESWRYYLEQDSHRELLYGKHIEKEDSKRDALSRACQALDDLLASINQAAPSDTKEQIQVLVYVDEAHVLIKDAPTNDYDKTYYDTFLSVFNAFVDKPVFCVFASTTSQMSHFVPTPELARSARAIRGGFLQPPITETPFDCCPDLPVQANFHTVNDVATLRFIYALGMFWTFSKDVPAGDVKLAWNLLDTAMAKLVGEDFFPNPTTSRDGLLAVVDVRLCLQYDTQPSSNRNIVADMVASHMRIAFSVPRHREIIRYGYPSEPMLAEAAAQALRTQRQHSDTVVIDVLNERFSSGLLNLGELGEVTARALVTEAYDRAVLREHPHEEGLLFSQGCSLITFIEELFEAENAAKILDSKPDNVRDGIPFREAFDAMFAAFVRGMAYICQNGQESVDFIVPVLLDRTALLSEQHMSGIFFKIKRRQRAGTKASLLNSWGSSQEARVPPSLAALLHHRHGFSFYLLGVVLYIGKPAPKAQSPLHSYTYLSQQLPPRDPQRVEYATSSTPGCSPAVYKMSSDHKIKYAQLLKRDSLLSDHPRPSTISHVRRQKPFWTIGPECYDWLTNEVLNPLPPPAGVVDDEGEVVISQYVETEDDV